MLIDYQKRRQRLFLLLSGLFLGTLAMLNILGLTRFLDLSFNVFGLQIPMVVAVGVLPYPITFMCTDLISELYGEKKARDLVWIGLILNVWVLFIIWLIMVDALLRNHKCLPPVRRFQKWNSRTSQYCAAR